jgi:hypothetical protein
MDFCNNLVCLLAYYENLQFYGSKKYKKVPAPAACTLKLFTAVINGFSYKARVVISSLQKPVI